MGIHLFFARKWANERFAPEMSDSLIRSFLVRDLSDSLTIAHFLWAMWANCSWLLIFGERPERFGHIAQSKWVIVSESLTSLTKNEPPNAFITVWGKQRFGEGVEERGTAQDSNQGWEFTHSLICSYYSNQISDCERPWANRSGCSEEMSEN